MYYLAVYGSLPSKDAYPLHVVDNWMLYDKYSSKVTQIPSSDGSCPKRAVLGERYNTNNKYAPPTGLSWIWHAYPYGALPANAWAEVIHKADPFGDEHWGAWFQYAPGSGIYFNLGTTISFPEHRDGYNHFHIAGGDENEEMSKAAAAAGIDSIQFLAHLDHYSYPCDTSHTGVAGFSYMGLEIVGTKLVGTYACTAPQGAPSNIKKGWKASRACVCDNSKGYLNCQGVPQMGLHAQAPNVTTVVI